MPAFSNTHIKHIAKVCHETNRAFCETRGDRTQLPWEQAPEWQRQSAFNGVKAHLENPDLTAEQSHELWLAEKHEQGWRFGRAKDVEAKTHPCFRPYAELPQDQQRKDALFKAIVDALREPYSEDRTNATEPFEPAHGVTDLSDATGHNDTPVQTSDAVIEAAVFGDEPLRSASQQDDFVDAPDEPEFANTVE